MSPGNGYYRMHRGWMDHPVFKSEPYTQREAWEWLIGEASFKSRQVNIGGNTVKLHRGQVCSSVRFMAEKWGWSKSRAARFLEKLQAESMIEKCSEIEPVSGTLPSILNICNYERFQANNTESGTETGTEAGQQRDKQEERRKKDKRKDTGVPPRSPYKFEGKIIRLNQKDFDEWQERFRFIPDLRASLWDHDDFLAAESKKSPTLAKQIKGNWFVRTKNKMRNENDKWAQKANPPPAEPCALDFLR